MIATLRDHPHLARQLSPPTRPIMEANLTIPGIKASLTTPGIKATLAILRITSQHQLHSLLITDSTGLRIVTRRFMSAILNTMRLRILHHHMCLPNRLLYMFSPHMFHLPNRLPYMFTPHIHMFNRLLRTHKVCIPNVSYLSIHVSNISSRVRTNNHNSTSRWCRQSVGRSMPSPLPLLGQ